MLTKGRAELNDIEWAGWWQHLHQKMTFGRKDPVGVMRDDLMTNFQCASIVLLIAMHWTPSLNVWWIKAICVCWVVLLVIQFAAMIVNYLNPWSSFSSQMEYLRESLRTPGTISSHSASHS